MLIYLFEDYDKLTKTWLKFGSTAIGVKTSEGVVLGVEKKLPSKLMEPTKSEKLVEVRTLMKLTIFLDRSPLWLCYEWHRRRCSHSR
jgi:hypothetical protein